MTASRVSALVFMALLLAAPAAASSHATKSLELCERAERLTGKKKNRALRRGLEIADRAVAASPNDARAHFAVVCNLGKQLHSRPLGLSNVAAVARLRRELDVALALAPGYSDALAAKGVILLKLPRVLGGDARQGEELLRQALAKDPDNAEARRYLSEVTTSDGAGFGR